MNRLTKIFLTIPYFLGLIYMLTFFSDSFLKWVSINIVRLEYQAPIVSFAIIIQIGFLIYVLWGFKNLGKDKKKEWTVLLLFFNIFVSLIFIWKKYDEFKKINK